MIDDDGKLRAGTCMRGSVSVWPRRRYDCAGPVSVEQRLMHTHRRWAHVRELMRALACICGYARERGDDFGKHGSRADQ